MLVEGKLFGLSLTVLYIHIERNIQKLLTMESRFFSYRRRISRYCDLLEWQTRMQRRYRAANVDLLLAILITFPLYEILPSIVTYVTYRLITLQFIRISGRMIFGGWWDQIHWLLPNFLVHRSAYSRGLRVGGTRG